MTYQYNASFVWPTQSNVFVGNVNSKQPTPQFTPTEKVKFAQIDAHTIQVMLLRIFLVGGYDGGIPIRRRWSILLFVWRVRFDSWPYHDVNINILVAFGWILTICLHLSIVNIAMCWTWPRKVLNILDVSSFQGRNIDENCWFSATSSLIGSIHQSMFSEESEDETKTPSHIPTSCHQQSDILVCTCG